MNTPHLKSINWETTPRNISPNGIHDDEKAKSLGFQGGFVPGIALYEHVCAGLINQDMNWLDTGYVELKFRKPVYSNETVTIELNEAEKTFNLYGDNPNDSRCSGLFIQAANHPELPNGKIQKQLQEPLGSSNLVGEMMEITREHDPSSFSEITSVTGFPNEINGKQLVPISQWGNPIYLIYEYFGLSTTIHYQGKIWHHSPLFAGEASVTRGLITGFSERNGNKLLELLTEISSDSGRKVATVEHSSVYELAKK
ncbi:MAG: hypothetical protein P8J64_06185 [Dehalococcoidia bacterium]|nr:hypothetical protein [Dehalococcoidia bacterium]